MTTFLRKALETVRLDLENNGELLNSDENRIKVINDALAESTTIVTFAVFMKGKIGAECFAVNGGWDDLAQFQKEMCLTDHGIEDHYFEIAEWALDYVILNEHAPYEKINTVMVFGDPSRAYFGECFAHTHCTLALVSEPEYETLL